MEEKAHWEFWFTVPASWADLILIAGYGLYYLFLAVLAAGILARLIWWAGRLNKRVWYFPDRSICGAVHQRCTIWWDSVRTLLFHKPQNASVLGLFCTPFWPLLITINLFLLA